MRLRSCFGLAAAALLLFLTGGPTSLAQNSDGASFSFFGSPAREPPQAARPRERQGSQQPRGEFRRSRERYAEPPPPAAPPQQTFFNPFAALFGAVSPPPVQPTYRDPRTQPREEPRRRVVRRPAPVKEAVKAPKVNPTTSIVVFGDSLAELVGQGIDDGFEEARQVAVLRKTRAESGVIASDTYDWVKAIGEYLGSPQKVTIAVLMMGLNDHQPIRDRDAPQDFLSDRWRQLYGDRVAALLAPFRERNIPVVFVGAPPLKNEKLSTEQIAVNEIIQNRVQRGGGVYVDIWPAFVDDQNRYAQMGANLEGQVTRLRLDDGVHFTRAGARKAAHFAEIELRRLIEEASKSATVASADAMVGVATPPDGTGVFGPAAPVDVAPPAKPIAGPVLPLTRVELAVGGVLTAGRPRFSGAAGALIERAYGEGVPPPPPAGRADDFRWPRS